jgi:HSP20 family protein
VVWELALLQRQIDSLFGVLSQPVEPSQPNWRPLVDLLEYPDRFIVRVDLPGVKREHLDLSLDRQELLVRGSKPATGGNRQHRRYHRMERSFGAFSLDVPLPGPVEASEARAALRRGVLEVVLPREDERARVPAQIPVSEEET